MFIKRQMKKYLAEKSKVLEKEQMQQFYLNF